MKKSHKNRMKFFKKKKKGGGARRSRSKDAASRRMRSPSPPIRDDKCPPVSSSSLKVVLSEVPIAVAKVDVLGAVSKKSYGGKVNASDENTPTAVAPSASIDAPEDAATPNAPLVAKEEFCSKVEKENKETVAAAEAMVFPQTSLAKPKEQLSMKIDIEPPKKPSKDYSEVSAAPSFNSTHSGSTTRVNNRSQGIFPAQSTKKRLCGNDNCNGDTDDDTDDDTEVQSSRNSTRSKDFSANLLPELDILGNNKWLSMGANALLQAIEGDDFFDDDDTYNDDSTFETQDGSKSDGESSYSTSTGGTRHSNWKGAHWEEGANALHGESDDDSTFGTQDGSISDGESRSLHSTSTGGTRHSSWKGAHGVADALHEESNDDYIVETLPPDENHVALRAKTNVSNSKRLSALSKALRSASPFENSASHAHKPPRAPLKTTNANSGASRKEADENLNDENASINSRTSNNLRSGASPSKFTVSSRPSNTNKPARTPLQTNRACPRAPEENTLLYSQVPTAGANAHKPLISVESFDASEMISELEGNRMANNTAELMNNIEMVLEGM